MTKYAFLSKVDKGVFYIAIGLKVSRFNGHLINDNVFISGYMVR